MTQTRAEDATAARNAVVSSDKRSRHAARPANYTTFEGRTGPRSDVIQRTDDGYARDATRTLPNGATHTRRADVSCAKDADECVKQVETGQQPQEEESGCS